MKTEPDQDQATRINRIRNLDLVCIKFKLLQPRPEGAWTLEKADEVELSYKRFLELNLKYRQDTIVPNRDIDTFWHYHILDTEKYAADCADCFGHFLHHFPYSGLRGDEDLANLKENYRKTKDKFMTEFGVTITGEGESCGEDPPEESCCPEYDCDTNGLLPGKGSHKARPRINRAAYALAATA